MADEEIYNVNIISRDTFKWIPLINKNSPVLNYDIKEPVLIKLLRHFPSLWILNNETNKVMTYKEFSQSGGGGIDTSDATATAEDIKLGKTAYIRDGKVTGVAESSLKKTLDSTKTTYYLFYNFKGNTIDGLFDYSDTNGVTVMNHMFYNCTSLTSVPLFDTSNVTVMNHMFYNCTSLTSVPLFDTSNVTTMNNMFANCKSLTSVPLFDTGNVTTMNYMFSDCYGLTSVPLFDTGNVTTMSNTFYKCTSLTSVPLFDTSKVTDMVSMFRECSSLTSVPLFDTSKVTDMGSMFANCTSLTSVPLFDTSKVTAMNTMFSTCIKLTSVPLFDTSKVTTMVSMFANCYELTSVPEFDMISVTSNNNMFYRCSALTNCFLRNIKVNLTVGSGTTYGHLLTLESLLFMIKELINVGSSRTFTIGTANLNKLTNVYVKTIEITDEMRAEDEYIDLKLPFEVCESTDEGARLITSYVTSKNWVLK